MRFYRILLNIFSSTSRNFVGLILGIVATPIILNYLGEEKYGAFRVLVDWTSQLGILEFGLYPSLLAIFAKSLSKSSGLSVGAVSHQAFRKYFLAMIYQVLGFVFIYFFLDELIPVSQETKADLNSALIILCVSLVFTFTQIFRAYLDAAQKGYIISSIMMVQNIVYIFLAVYCAYMGWGITGQAAATFASLAIAFIIFYVKARKYLQWDRIRPLEKKSFSLSLKQQRVSHFIANLCGRASLVSDNLIVSALLGAKAVTAFFLTQRLLVIGRQQLQQLSNATWPAMSELYFQKEKEKFAERVIEVTEFVSFASGALLSVLCFINPPFVILWTGESTFAGLSLNFIVLFNVGLFAIITFWQWCFTGTGNIQKIIPLLIVQTIVNVGLSIYLTGPLGLLGPPIGTLVSFLLVTTVWMSILMAKEFELSLLSLTRSWAIPFALPVSISIFSVYKLGYPNLNNWFLLAAVSLISGILTLFVFSFIFLSSRSRKRFLGRLKTILAKRFQ